MDSGLDASHRPGMTVVGQFLSADASPHPDPLPAGGEREKGSSHGALFTVILLLTAAGVTSPRNAGRGRIAKQSG